MGVDTPPWSLLGWLLDIGRSMVCPGHKSIKAREAFEKPALEAKHNTNSEEWGGHQGERGKRSLGAPYPRERESGGQRGAATLI